MVIVNIQRLKDLILIDSYSSSQYFPNDRFHIILTRFSRILNQLPLKKGLKTQGLFEFLNTIQALAISPVLASTPDSHAWGVPNGSTEMF